MLQQSKKEEFHFCTSDGLMNTLRLINQPAQLTITYLGFILRGTDYSQKLFAKTF